jgi:hypothetical protein
MSLGKASFLNLPKGDMYFELLTQGKAIGQKPSLSPDRHQQKSTIHEQSFNVHVINSQGSPLKDVPVYAYNTAEQFTGMESVTDQNGMVTLTLPDGSYTFRADYHSQVIWSDSVDTPENSSVDIRVPISQFSVRVYRRNGQAVGDVPVYAFTDEENYTGIKTVADQKGLAVLELPDGRYQFRADYQGGGYWSDSITSPDVNSTSLYVGGFDVTVQVTDSTGITLSNRTVYVYNSDGEYLNLGKSTDGNGKAVFELNEGKYIFRAVGDNNQNYWSDTVDVSGATNATILIQRSGFVVTVTGNTQGQSIAVYVYRYPNYKYTGMATYIDQNNQAEFDIGGGRYIFLVYNFTQGRYVWSDDVKLPSQQSITINIP